jgi:putative sterol carrier protein
MAGQIYVELAAGGERIHGDMTREGLAAANAEWLARDPERRGDRLADAIVSSTRTFLDSVDARPASQPVVTPAGKMEMDILVPYALTHTMMHACAVAGALRRKPPLRKEHVKLMMPFLTVGMENFVRKDKTKDLTASFLLHLRGGPKVAVTFDKGALSIGTLPPRRVDCHIWADPVALFLVAMGMKKQWGAIATGKLMTSGTKPWLALQFVGLFATP